MFKTYRIETVWITDRTVAAKDDFASAEAAVAWNEKHPIDDKRFERVLYCIEELPLYHADFATKCA